jgi:hypothetical protein
MTSHPKTIQIVLPSGEPHGIRIAEIMGVTTVARPGDDGLRTV